MQHDCMRNAGTVQAALANLVEKFVADMLGLVQRTALAEVAGLKAPRARASLRAASTPRAPRAVGEKRSPGRPGRPPKLSENDRQKFVAKALRAIAKAESGATMKVIQDAIGADIPTTKRLLRELLKANAVRTTGKTRATAYFPVGGALLEAEGEGDAEGASDAPATES